MHLVKGNTVGIVIEHRIAINLLHVKFNDLPMLDGLAVTKAYNAVTKPGVVLNIFYSTVAGNKTCHCNGDCSNVFGHSGSVVSDANIF